MALRNTHPERYPKLIEFYDRGKANATEYLEADFGQFPPNNLNIVNPPDFDVTFKSMFKTVPGVLRTLPSFTSLVIFANTFKPFPIMSTLFLLGTTALKTLSLGGFVMKDKPTVHLNHMYRWFAQSQSGRRYLSHVLSHEFQHVVQQRDLQESLSSSFDGDRLGIAGLLKDDASKYQKYLADEAEIQARLHTVVVGAYHQFERMPTNHFELMSMLATQGIATFPTMMGLGAGRAYKKDTELFDRYADKSAIDGLKDVIKAIDPKHKSDFFNRVLPFVYGDLIELYGDQQGHKRFGHTHNIQLREVFYKAAKDIDVAERKIRATPPEKREKLIQQIEDGMNRVVSSIGAMDKDDATSLGCMIACGDIYQEYGRSIMISSRMNVGRDALNLIWKRSDLTNADRVLLKRTYDASNRRHPDYDAEVHAHRPPGGTPSRNKTIDIIPGVVRGGRIREFAFA